MTEGRNFVFVGFMGAGKSTAARAVAGAEGVEAIDADRVFEERFGPIEAFFASHGEAAFREREEALVLELLDRGGILSLGGGAVESPRIRAALRDRVVVWLDADAETCWRRVRFSDRPLAADRDAFVARFQARRPLYEEVASAVIPSATSIKLALSTLRVLPAGARMVWATAAGGAEYPVLVGRGVRAMDFPAPGRAVEVTDEHVAPLWAGEGAIVVPPGEQHKSLATAERVWTELVERGVTRGDHLRGVGGGVVTDLAGFCAATYQRGIPVVQVPTTIVGQVDAAIGGKTGVDLPGAKNYVGAYHQPLAVLCDTETLSTLPASERAAGYPEVVKTALIAGGALWERVSAGEALDDAMIFACARTKVAVVASDERDAGLRQVLNLGHTVAHAIEVVSAYAVAHGPAVALGLLAALRLSGQDELRSSVRALLAGAGLATSLPSLDVEAVVEATRRDKKRIGAEVPFVLVFAPGDVRHGQRVEEAALRAAVEELRSS